MKASGGPQKLRYTLAYVSEEDPDYPARELLYHSPATRGWQSPRFSKYPQEIGFRLEHPCKVQQIQILSHEYKIATKLEIMVGEASPDADYMRIPFKRLGYLSFDPNERSNFQARELKSVNINVSAFYVKLVIHRCHVNKQNIYNQVGIIALNLIGEAIQPGIAMPPGGFLQLHPPISKELNYYNAAAAHVADLNLDLHVDTVTAAKIRELAQAKDAAVANEDYDEAKRLKASIERLRVVGQKIAQLEARKRAAVEREDYDEAKLIKIDIDKLRATGESTAGTLPGPGGKNPDEIFNRVLKGVPATPMGHGGPTSPGAYPPVEAQHSYHQAGMPPDGMPPPGVDDGYSGGYGLYAEHGLMSNKAVEYDERPAVGKGRYTPGMEGDPTGGLGGAPPPGAPGGGQGDHSAPNGFPPDLPAPEELPSAVAKEAEPLEDIAGDYAARAFYSKNWQLREAAMQYLEELLKRNELQDKKDAFKTMIRMVHKAMRDKVAGVYLGALTLFRAVIDGFGDAAGSSNVASACDATLPILIGKLGDTNARLASASRESIMFIAGLKDAQLSQSAGLFIKPIKNQNAWRPVLGILNLLQELVPTLGISKAGNADGFELHDLMEFVGKAYNSSNGDTRSASVRMTKIVFDMVGPSIRKTLPADINPKIKEQIEEILSGGGEPAPPLPPPAPAAMAAPTPKSTRGPGPAGGKPERGGKASQAVANMAQGLPVEPEPAPAAAPADDPAPFEAELAAREAELGADHPDVAETCSNLAILYSQKGDPQKALPLYERALGIYEGKYGKDHPEVAHTLTDLAVLHLELGQDDIGRPLLERALAIQEQALGPDHPDVVAIRDVLES